MSEYTPKTDDVREDYAIGRNEVIGAGWYSQHRAEFDSWLAAHDAEKRAEWEAEQGETEWGVAYEQSDGLFVDPAVDEQDAHYRVDGSSVYDLVVSRKSNPWLPVPDTANNESEGKA